MMTQENDLFSCSRVFEMYLLRSLFAVHRPATSYESTMILEYVQLILIISCQSCGPHQGPIKPKWGPGPDTIWCPLPRSQVDFHENTYICKLSSVYWKNNQTLIPIDCTLILVNFVPLSPTHKQARVKICMFVN